MKSNPEIVYDLCVIGMGIGGLNALNSSLSYLPKNAKIIVIDKRDSEHAIGGMWNTAYPFVRLHQPHGMFTVGNKKWKWNKQPSHLANREEIIQHFQGCYQEIKNDYSITEKFGCLYKSHQEVKVGDGYEAHIICQPLDDNQKSILIKTKRCIKAFGINVSPNEALELSTDKVRSIAPESVELMDGQLINDDKPIYIIGGGKTSMDVAYHILTHNPNRKVNFVLGKGSFFANRADLFPEGLKKYWAGTTLISFLCDATKTYDGNVVDSIMRIRDKHGLVPFKDADRSFLGIISPEEIETITNGMDKVIYRYLSDVIQKGNGIFLQFKNGEEYPIEEDSWIINTTGLLYPKENLGETILTYKDSVLSPHKTVLSIIMTNSALVFSSFGGYFLPHLWFRDLFHKFPIFEYNHIDLVKKSKQMAFFGISAQVIHNLIYLIDALPIKIVYQCQLNFDKWYPLHRQGFVLLEILLNRKKYLERCAKIFRDIEEKYEVECGWVGQ